MLGIGCCDVVGGDFDVYGGGYWCVFGFSILYRMFMRKLVMSMLMVIIRKSVCMSG